jgi:hypothetical protein
MATWGAERRVSELVNVVRERKLAETFRNLKEVPVQIALQGQAVFASSAGHNVISDSPVTDLHSGGVPAPGGVGHVRERHPHRRFHWFHRRGWGQNWFTGDRGHSRRTRSRHPGLAGWVRRAVCARGRQFCRSIPREIHHHDGPSCSMLKRLRPEVSSWWAGGAGGTRRQPRDRQARIAAV